MAAHERGAPLARASAGLVMVHGRGATAESILDLGDALALSDLAMMAPQAPGLSWWPTSFLASTASIEPFVADGLAAVGDAIRSLEAGGLARRNIGVLGFSQGACLALEYVAREGAGLGFVFAMSGALVGTADAGTPPDPALYGHPEKLFDYVTDLSGVQGYVSCHAQDPHIPFKRFDDSVTRMRDLGVTVVSRTKPGAGHGVDKDDVAAIRAALNG